MEHYTITLTLLAISAFMIIFLLICPRPTKTYLKTIRDFILGLSVSFILFFMIVKFLFVLYFGFFMS
jgi:hypothetical protein